MSLFSEKQENCQCKKELLDEQAKQIDSECTCPDFVQPNEGLPECYLLRTPDLDDSSIYKSTERVCAKCLTNVILCYDWIAEQRFCYKCASKLLKDLNNIQSTDNAPFLFYYPVSDQKAEEEF